MFSISGNNLSSDDLVCSNQLAGSAITDATAWYKNVSPYLILLIPFEGGQSNALLDVSGNNASITIGGNPTLNPIRGYDGNGAFEFDKKRLSNCRRRFSSIFIIYKNSLNI